MRSSLVAVVLLAAAPAVASAAPLAVLSADVDGDGAAESIELGADGALRVHGTAVQLASAPTKATLAVAPLPGAAAGSHGKLAILAKLTTARGDEAVIVTRGAAGAWQVAWRGEIGGVGLDAEYAIEVDATPTGLVRYQKRFNFSRCDNKLALLFAEDFDGAKFVRAAKLPIDVPPNAPTLTARLDTQAASTPFAFHATAASYEASATDAGTLSRPSELDDGNPATAWREDLPSAGEGQFFTFKARGDAKASQLRVMAGDHSTAAELQRANRPRELAIVSMQGAWRVELPDAAREPIGAAYVVDLPQPIAGCVTVVLASTYGKPGGATAISELEVFAEGERANGGAEAMAARAVANDEPGAHTYAQQLAQHGGASLPAIEAELGRATTSAPRQRLVRVLVEIRDPAAAPLLARAATSGWVEGAELVAVATALGALHQEHELHELAAKSDLALDVRVAAAGALDPASPDGLTALVELAGAGPRELRHAVIERLAAAPAAVLVAAAQAQAAAPASGDLWRAATRAARARPGERPTVLAAMSAALAAATDYERRYRLVDGVAALGDSPALTTLASWLAALPAGTESAALRQVAARALATSPRPEALDLILTLTRDGDPGVRLGALGALMQGGDDATGAPGPWHTAAGPDTVDRAIGSLLARDGWTDVRVRAAQALGGRCARPGPAAMLVAALGTDATLEVRAESLVSLVQCRASGVADLLAHTWDDAKAPLELRTRAISLAITLGDRALGAKLVGELAAWRGAAIESKPALGLAVEAANAIGKLGAPGAEAALLDALDDSAFPEIVGAAAAGLGALGPACSPAAKTKLGILARGDDPQVAVPATHAARVCGKPAR